MQDRLQGKRQQTRDEIFHISRGHKENEDETCNDKQKDSLVEKITQGTYEDLGITPNEIESLDPTPDGQITPEDARVIVDKFEFEDKPELREELANYYTKITKKLILLRKYIQVIIIQKLKKGIYIILTILLH